MNRHQCRFPGCPTLLKRSGYCQAHTASANYNKNLFARLQRKSDPLNAQSAAIRSSARWNKVRRLKLSTDPMCADPHGDHTKANSTESAKQVHHIVSLRDNPDAAFDWSNLMSVCTKCHSKFNRIERMSDDERPAIPTQTIEPSLYANRYF